MAPQSPASTRPRDGATASGDTRWRTGLRIAIGVLLILQGLNHFVSDEIMIRMMPSWLPAHRELVWASGVAEIVLGAGALLRRTRQLAGWGILLLLVAVWPANWTMALAPEQWPIPGWLLWLRLPLQLVFAYGVWASCIAPERSRTAERA
jgi:uncharacterized membrane protein